MRKFDINSASKDLQELYLNDAFFKHCVMSGLDAEGIILAMAKRNKEISDEMKLRAICSCQVVPLYIKDH